MPCPRSARTNAIPSPSGWGDTIKTWCPPSRSHFSATTLPPLSVQAFSLFVSVVPWPLQPFWPLQALFALWHEPWPLHSLTPAHLTTVLDAFCSFSLAWAAPDANSEPTAAAITAPFSISLTIGFLSRVGYCRSSLAKRGYVTADAALRDRTADPVRYSGGARRRGCLRASRCPAAAASRGFPPPPPPPTGTPKACAARAAGRRRERAGPGRPSGRALQRSGDPARPALRAPRARAARRPRSRARRPPAGRRALRPRPAGAPRRRSRPGPPARSSGGPWTERAPE